MAFTYSNTLTLSRDKIRLMIGDTVQDKGPRPRKTNFDDNEIAYFLSAQSNSTNKATAMAFEALAGEWMAYSIQQREGDLSYDAKGLADRYFALAKEWWAKPEDGSASGSLQAGVILMDFAEKGDYP